MVNKNFKIMNLEKKITVCVFTHIIEASTNPYLDNRMLIDTIKSTYAYQWKLLFELGTLGKLK